MAGQATDALEQLEQEHRQVEQLLDQLEDTDPGEQRNALVAELTTALEDHMAFEESQLYPIVRDALGEEDAVEAETEHGLARDGLSQLSELLEEPGFGAAVAMLKAGIGHHVEEEESEMFPKLRQEAPSAVAQLVRHGPGEQSPGEQSPGEQSPGEQSPGEQSGSDGAALETDLREATKEELYEAAKSADVPGRSSMTKEELVEALESN